MFVQANNIQAKIWDEGAHAYRNLTPLEVEAMMPEEGGHWQKPSPFTEVVGFRKTLNKKKGEKEPYVKLKVWGYDQRELFAGKGLYAVAEEQFVKTETYPDKLTLQPVTRPIFTVKMIRSLPKRDIVSKS